MDHSHISIKKTHVGQGPKCVCSCTIPALDCHLSIVTVEDSSCSDRSIEILPGKVYAMEGEQMSPTCIFQTRHKSDTCYIHNIWLDSPKKHVMHNPLLLSSSTIGLRHTRYNLRLLPSHSTDTHPWSRSYKLVAGTVITHSRKDLSLYSFDLIWLQPKMAAVYSATKRSLEVALPIHTIHLS